MTTSAPTTSTTTPVELARKLFALIDAKDLDSAAPYWHEHVVEDIVAVGTFHGRAEVRRFFEETYAAFPDFSIKADTIIGDDRVAFASWNVSGTFSGAPFQGVAPTGALVELRGVDRMEFEGGKLVRNTVYYDGMSFARAVGMMPAAQSAAESAMKSTFNAVTAVKKRLGL